MALTFLDRVNLARLWAQTALGAYRQWRPILHGLSGTRVYYGFDRIPAPDEPAFGGIVKIQDLQRVYPNQARGANILYLVSSALPYFAVRMARLARKAGAKIVVNQNGVAYPGWFGKGWDTHNRPNRRLLEMADHVFYQSRFCKTSADRFIGERKRSFEILHNPVDTEIFRPGRQSDQPDQPVSILLAGSHQKFYRVQAAVETLSIVLRKFPSTRLCIAGRCSWEKEEATAIARVERLARQRNVHGQIDLVGPYTQTQAPALFRRAQILLHTKYNDPCPRLVVEAMACGLPVVYSATGGVPELVDDASGVGVPGPVDWEADHPPDPADLAAAIVRVMGNLDRYRAAARNRAVGTFDVRPWLDRHKRLFETITG